ncbi:MAG: aromatic ring-hydroxylating dioxygenase subunit alpha [Gammaproteobacteria bacterium]|nr:aromatic ring-hydroxylating dioxygenase subunit alpha [Gammaproteobacteria bacterium]|tara:strand:+ start:171 stop:1376 length:1206 start_codon:yes stop_codon:yes gene_type:complete
MNTIKELLNNQQEDWSLDQKFYKDTSIFDLEKHNIFYNSWIFIGHESQIPNKGDFFVYKLLDEEIIVLRNKENKVKAFFNVCRHRGSRVCLEEKGNTSRFSCPYHSWTYNLDGKLLAAKSLREGIDKSKLGLHPCNIESASGMLLINLSDNPQSLKNLQSDLKEPFEMFGFKDLKVAAHKNYPIASNWKLAVENYQECYHCAPAHPEYSLSHSLKIEDEPGFDEAQEKMMNNLESCGLKDIEVNKDFSNKDPDQEQYAYSRYALFDGYMTGSKDGKPLAPLLGDIKEFNQGCSDFNIGPVSYFLAYCDHIVGYIFTPTSQDQCQCDIYWLVNKDAEENKDYDKEKLMWLWDVTTYADETIIVNNQKGVNSIKYQSGPYTDKEQSTRRFIKWYLSELKSHAL